MKNVVALLLVSIFVMVSCGTKMESEEIHGLVFGYSRGLMLGVDIGDSWEDVKKNCRSGWAIREEDQIYQLRKDWDMGNDMMYASFNLDDRNTVQEMEFSITASGGNILELKKLHQKFIQDFNLITSQNLKTDWQYSAPNGNLYTIMLTSMELDDKKQMLTVYTILHLQ
ncbi:MAG: hypothetical protein AB8B74_09655 [Crocinitomicaceae bacterium]